jgi:aryl-alcohol dehydrogenase-like predicted oxidoreductase
MNFGWHTAQEESFKIMDRALELGINFFDTADVYGRGCEQGDTEEILGSWFAQGGGRRDAVILATKVFNPVKRKANLAEPNTDGRSLSAYKIRKHSEGSLKRLQTDHIDLYQMHHVDRDCPGTRLGKPLSNWATRARWFTWDLATSRDGTSLPLARRLLNAVWRG